MKGSLQDYLRTKVEDHLSNTNNATLILRINQTKSYIFESRLKYK